MRSGNMNANISKNLAFSAVMEDLGEVVTLFRVASARRASFLVRLVPMTSVLIYTKLDDSTLESRSL